MSMDYRHRGRGRIGGSGQVIEIDESGLAKGNCTEGASWMGTGY